MNFFTYLDTQKQEDRQAFIIHYPAGQGKSHFAQRACQLRQGLYLLDLLEQFKLDANLKVRTFTPEHLQGYLLKFAYPPGTHTVWVDNGDFLFNTWSRQQKEDFIQWMRYPLRTPGLIDKTFILLVQTDKVFSTADLVNSRGQPRVLALNDFDML